MTDRACLNKGGREAGLEPAALRPGRSALANPGYTLVYFKKEPICMLCYSPIIRIK